MMLFCMNTVCVSPEFYVPVMFSSDSRRYTVQINFYFTLSFMVVLCWLSLLDLFENKKVDLFDIEVKRNFIITFVVVTRRNDVLVYNCILFSHEE